MKRLLKEPLLHFVILGAAVFALFEMFDDTPPPMDERAITVTEDTVRRLAAEFEATWRRAPNVDEIDRLIEHFVNEEVYVREAKALGLDRGDAIVRRRLQMKMEFLTEAGAQSVNPDDATLAAHLAANADRFSRSPILAVEQVFLGDDVETARSAEIAARLNEGGDPNAVGERSLLPPALPPSPARVIDGTFGTGFFERLMELPEGAWVGPVRTTFGQHLVRVTDRRKGSLPPLEDIRDAVLQDWRATLTAQLREERLIAMRARYEIIRPDAAEVLSK
ncbi:MAG: peptidylprolyl isomerase [Roseobacter sp.]|nr:peptidylprolyl isomerase [Roseobacter sp.]